MAPQTVFHNFWDRIHNEKGAVCSEYQFREGDFTTGFESLRRVLQAHGLWDIMTKGSCLSADASEEELHEIEVLESWAVNHALPFICDSIQDRWTLERPITGPQLLGFLEKTACQPFRLNDLPTELREHVYEHFDCSIPRHTKICPEMDNSSDRYVVGVTDSYDAKKDLREVRIDTYLANQRPDRRYMFKPYTYQRQAEDEPRACLSLVCRDFRDFVEETQLGKPTFNFWIASGNFDHFLRWVETIGIERLSRVRSIRVTIQYYSDMYDEITVSYDPVHGLTAVWERDDIMRIELKTLTEHTSRISRRKVREGWNSTGVFECFTADPDGLRHACWGSEYISGVSHGEDDEGEPDSINERNAYSVAYGHFATRCWWQGLSLERAEFYFD